MISKSQISVIASLNQKKFRKQEGLFVAEGQKVVEDLLSSSFAIKKIYATEQFLETHDHRKRSTSDIEWIDVNEAELKKISSLATPNQVLALCEIPSYEIDKEKILNSLSLVLDDISDPGNLGTIIRIADWFGIENIICSTDTADCYNPKVVQASMGSLFRIKIHYIDLNEFLEQNSMDAKIPVYGMMLKGADIYSADLSNSGLILIGNESTGIRQEISKHVLNSLSIPSFATEETHKPDSLNAAVATAIACSEFRRRQMSDS